MSNNYDILKRLIERIILPKYPFLKLKDIESFYLTNFEEYDVRFITKEKIDPEIQTQIDTEVKSLFKMASLDLKKRALRDKVLVWFKTPRQKDWTFHGKAGYEH